MKPLYTQEEFNLATSITLLPCECYVCKTTFYKEKRAINKVLRNLKYHDGKYCSKKCQANNKKTQKLLKCTNCNVEFIKKISQIKKSKNHFCSHSCNASYNNKHKTTGTRRSKLETWLEQQLPLLYSNLEFHFNKKDIIGSELDIYIPSLKLAFELNGVFHYEPIYGSTKLNQIKTNDISKSKACYDAKIDLCIIDTSKQSYFKPKTSKIYLDIITNIIKERLEQNT